MLVFIDESGDPGLRLDQGASRCFSIALVMFDDHDQAIACDRRIELLTTELGWDSASEFHFKANSDKVRQAFLSAVAPYNFFYYGIVINKDPAKLWGEGFKHKHSFYKYACSLLFENAKNKLEEAIVVIDESGSEDFKRQLSIYKGSNLPLHACEYAGPIPKGHHKMIKFLKQLFNRSKQPPLGKDPVDLPEPKPCYIRGQSLTFDMS